MYISPTNQSSVKQLVCVLEFVKVMYYIIPRSKDLI